MSSIVIPKPGNYSYSSTVKEIYKAYSVIFCQKCNEVLKRQQQQKDKYDKCLYEQFPYTYIERYYTHTCTHKYIQTQRAILEKRSHSDMKQSIKDGKQENLPYTMPPHSNY